ncbi:MAG: hypothetical protein OHK93_006164 [Ramalina farinacea]|uniref:Inhibitor of growth protein N-terminal histone-binding domain-containing protein n=1 Tax=Ramalina farinacea TaxID=258253 RepID=A0AA43TWI2_9LECA|nr:hypothetical protein [Ramalina farinacea]
MSSSIMLMPQNKSDDPDAQATVNDFLDYTEYLPSDLNRALTLIGKLDETYAQRADKVHNLTRIYGQPVETHVGEPRDNAALRTEISYNLNNAIKARESAYGEAERLHEMVNRHYNRLRGIKSKLNALPKPPSRDPTPVPRSPQITRKTPPPRITLRLDTARLGATTGRVADKEKKKMHRSRRVTVPGEVLPPPNPDSPQISDSDWESLPQSPLPIPTSRVGGSRSRSHRPPRIRHHKVPKPPKDRTPRAPRPPGTGTNVHSSVAGISTSNALSMLAKPPSDAPRGSEHAPWMRLTEYEMALLRKRMKKNAIWTPSETMIRRELAEGGRGPDNYRKVRAEAEENGDEFIDVDNIATTAPGKPLAPGEMSSESLALASSNLSNRGMKLNEAKKQKREALLLASLQETQQAAKRLEDLGTNFKDLFKKPLSLSISSPLTTPTLPSTESVVQDQPSKKERKKSSDHTKEDKKASSKKRKHSELSKIEPATVPVEAEAPSPEKSTAKKRKRPDSPATITTTQTTIVPLAEPGPSPSKPHSQASEAAIPSTPITPSMPAPEKPKSSTAPSKDIITATSSRPRRISLTLRGPSSPPVSELPTRPPSRAAAGRRESTAPLSATLPREQRRRKSATPATPVTPATPGPVLTAAARRSKRPMPGTLVQSDEGSAAITRGKRTKPPKKHASVLTNVAGNTPRRRSSMKDQGMESQVEEQAAGEIIDPNEPTFCLCGDVSWGEMIGCDDEDVSGFCHHLSENAN